MRLPRRRRLAFGVGALLLALAPAARTAEVRDMLGRRVAVADRPARVVSLAPSVTEILYALGAGDRLVGVTDHCDYPEEARKKPRVGGFYRPNFEKILSLRPDLILATSIEGGRAETFQGIEAFRIPVYVVRPVDVPAVLESIARVGAVLGLEREAARLSDAMRREVDRIARTVKGLGRPRVLYVVWGKPLIVPGRETLITDLIRRAGGESVTGAEPFAYPRFSAEAAVARDPDVVVLGQHRGASVGEQLRDWDHLGLLRAVREGRVYAIDGDLTHRPGPRIVDALRTLARLIHPEAGW